MADEPDEDDRPGEDDFARWLRPKQALALRGTLHDHGAVDILLTRLKAREIPAAAARAKWVYEGEPNDASRTPFPESWWDRVQVDNAHDLFWTAPVSDLTVRRDRGGNPIYFLDVRFEPKAVREAFGLPPSEGVDLPSPNAGFRPGPGKDIGFTKEEFAELKERMARPPGGAATSAHPAPQPSSAPNRRVTDSKLTDWYERHAAQNPGAVYHVVKSAADAKFSPLTVGKNQLYRVMGRVSGVLKRGNPAIYRQ